MHHPKFQYMESRWRGLAYLVQNTQFDKGIKLEILSTSKDELADDLAGGKTINESGLFHHLYKSEYDQAGGEPFTAVIADYYFDHSQADANLLRLIAACCAKVQAPSLPPLMHRCSN